MAIKVEEAQSIDMASNGLTETKVSGGFTPINATASDDIKTEDQPPSPPKTPTKKRKSGAQASNGDGNDASAKKPKKTKKEVSPRAAKQKVAESPEDLTSADRILYTMRKNGSTFSEIITAIETATGEKKPRQTLQARFPKVAAIMEAVEEEDYGKVMGYVAEVDAAIEKQVQELKSKRFVKVGELMKENGHKEYPVPALEKCYQKLSAKGENAVPAVDEDKSEVDE